MCINYVTRNVHNSPAMIVLRVREKKVFRRFFNLLLNSYGFGPLRTNSYTPAACYHVVFIRALNSIIHVFDFFNIVFKTGKIYSSLSLPSRFSNSPNDSAVYFYFFFSVHPRLFVSRKHCAPYRPNFTSFENPYEFYINEGGRGYRAREFFLTILKTAYTIQYTFRREFVDL